MLSIVSHNSFLRRLITSKKDAFDECKLSAGHESFADVLGTLLATGAFCENELLESGTFVKEAVVGVFCNLFGFLSLVSLILRLVPLT